jgi:hypothetical protein
VTKQKQENKADAFCALKTAVVAIFGENAFEPVVDTEGREVGVLVGFDTTDQHLISIYASVVHGQVTIAGTCFYEGLYEFVKDNQNRLCVLEKINSWNDQMQGTTFSLRENEDRAAIRAIRCFLPVGMEQGCFTEALEQNVKIILSSFMSVVSPFMLLLPEAKSSAVDDDDYQSTPAVQGTYPC